MAKDYAAISKKIVENIGGVENIASVTHCMTRLRFVVKDEGKINDAAVKATDGVMGVVNQGGQYQIIIGQAVNDAYRLICEKNGFAVEKSVDEQLDDEKPAQKKGAKAVIDKIFDGISRIGVAKCGGNI